MRILVIASKDPKLDMLHIVDSAYVSLIIVLGDLDYMQVFALQHITKVPKIGIKGKTNGDLSLNQIGVTDIDNTIFTHLGVSFSGISGTRTTLSIKDQVTSDVVISHAGPTGVGEESGSMSDELQDFIKKTKPKLVIYADSSSQVENAKFKYYDTAVEFVNGWGVVTIE